MFTFDKNPTRFFSNHSFFLNQNHDAKTEPRPSRHVRNDSQGSISSLPNSRPQTPNKLADIPEHEDEHPSPEEHYTHIPFPTQPANREELSLSVDGLPELPRRNSSGRRKRQGALPKVPEEHNNGGVMTSGNNVISGGNQYTWLWGKAVRKINKPVML